MDQVHFSDDLPTTLKKRRKQLNLSLEEATQALKVSRKRLQLIESGTFSELEHNIYTREFIRRYSQFLGLDGDVAVRKYLAERGPVPKPKQRLEKEGPKGSLVTVNLLRWLGVGLVALAVLGYVGWQAMILVTPPKLNVSQPPEDQTVTKQKTTVAGETIPGAEVFVNETPVYVDESGRFETTIGLHDGVNTIVIEARNRSDKSRVVTRNILRKESQ